MNKHDLRIKMLDKRINIDKETLESNSKIISDIFLSSKEYKSADNILIYVSMKGEVTTKDIINDAFLKKKNVACPKVKNGEIKFYNICSFDVLEPASFGINEPDKTCSEFINKGNTLIIVPGVLFDVDKNRIGYGKGYYDKYLSSHKNLKSVALCHDFQILNSIPNDEYDIKMDKIISEKRIIK